MLWPAEARNSCFLVLAIALSSSAAMAEQGLKPITVDGVQVVYDSNNNVNWLADANFAASDEPSLGGPGGMLV